MNFKEGDEAWWFEYPEQCLGRTSDIALKNSIICKVDNEYMVLDIGHSLRIFDVDVYHSREDALEAILERIEQINDEILN